MHDTGCKICPPPLAPAGLAVVEKSQFAESVGDIHVAIVMHSLSLALVLLHRVKWHARLEGPQTLDPYRKCPGRNASRAREDVVPGHFR